MNLSAELQQYSFPNSNSITVCNWVDRNPQKNEMNKLELFEDIVSNEPNCHQLFIEKALSVIDQNMAVESFSLSQFSKQMNLSKSATRRNIKLYFALTPCELIRSIRIDKSKQLLSNNSLNVSEVAFKVGYCDPKYFSRNFKNKIGLSPTEYRESICKGGSMRINQWKNDYLFKKVISKIEEKIDDSTYTHDQLASDLNVSKSTLYRRLKLYSGLSPHALILKTRVNHSINLLKPNIYISDVAFACGFNDPKHFSRCFRAEFGVSPSKFQVLSQVLSQVV